MNPSPEHVPVLIGVGEVVDRSRDPAQGREPLALMLDALREAQADAGAGLLAQVDSLDVVCEYSWPYVDAPGLVARGAGMQPARACYGEVGGESPVRFIHEAALRIQRGESQLAAIVGAEATYTTAAAMKAGVNLPWAERDKKAQLLTGREFSAPVAVDHGVCIPTNVYPLYENAASAHWGQTQGEALEESGQVWSAMSRLAAANPHAWLREPYTAQAITTPSERNRLIAWPYTKHMVANPLVNQGAAVLVASVARARALGIDPSRWVYLHGGASAQEPRDYLARDRYVDSHAQTEVLRAALRLGGGDISRFAALELYSCFPCVPKMARRVLGLPADANLSVTGGLSFFGAPLNNYMTHAAAAMVRQLRAAPGARGLLYGQGEFVTKHHALVLSTAPSDAPLVADYSVQAQADARRGAVPAFVHDHEGTASVETFTVLYARDGQPEYAAVIARTPDGSRLMARVPGSDARTLSHLTRLDAQPVGSAGQVTWLDAKRLRWTLD